MGKFFRGIRRAIFGLTAKEKEAELRVELEAEALSKRMAEMFSGRVNPFCGEAKKDTPEQLKALFDSYTNAETFAPGDLVMWKDGLKNRMNPAYGEPAVVISITPGVVSTSDESGGAYFREDLSMRAGVVKDGMLFLLHFDPARFTKYIAQPDAAQESAGTI